MQSNAASLVVVNWSPWIEIGSKNNYGTMMDKKRLIAPIFCHRDDPKHRGFPAGLVDVTLPQHLESHLGPMPVTEVSAVSCPGNLLANAA